MTITKLQPNERKSRHTFPNELDTYHTNTVKRKRRNSTPNISEQSIDNYNEKRIIIRQCADGMEKEIIIKKYTKVHPTIEDEITESDSDNEMKRLNDAISTISKFVIKSLCYLGIFSCVAI